MNSAMRSIENSHGGPRVTGAAIHRDIVPPATASQSLVWIVPLTLLWILLIYWQPAIFTSGVLSAAARLITYGLIGVGLWVGIESTRLTLGQSRKTWLAVMVPY